MIGLLPALMLALAVPAAAETVGHWLAQAPNQDHRNDSFGGLYACSLIVWNILIWASLGLARLGLGRGLSEKI